MGAARPRRRCRRPGSSSGTAGARWASFLGPLDPRLRRALAAASACSQPGAQAGIGEVTARRLSLGGGVVTWGRKRLSPAFYALPGRRLARLRDRPPSAVHGLEPLLRRARRGARAAFPHRAHALDDGGLRARARRRGAHARRAERPAAADAIPAPRARRARRRRRSRERARSASGRRRAGATGCSPSSPSARSSSPPTTSSGSAGASTTPGGSRSPGAGFPVLTAYFAQAGTLRAAGAARGRLRDRDDPRPAHALDARPRTPAASAGRSPASNRWSARCGSCRWRTSCSAPRSSARA